MKRMGRLDGKVVVVTGAARGIGRATAELAAKEGARVAICDIKDELGVAAARAITESGGKANYYHMDITKEPEVSDVFSRISTDLGMVYGLVNNAGIDGVDKPVHQLEEKEWDAVMDVNLKGTFFCTKHAIPYMMKNGSGSIVNFSSTWGIVGSKHIPQYHASKGAVRLLTKAGAVYYATHKIRLNSIHPGLIDTELIKEFAAASGDPKGIYEELTKMHPMNRIGRPEEIAKGVLFLLSDDSSFMTGSELVIDGGYTSI